MPTNHGHDPLTIPNAARHPRTTSNVIHSLWRAARWKTRIYPICLIPTTIQLALQRNTRKVGMTISKLEAKRDELDAGFGRRDEDRAVTARSRRAALSRFASANPWLPPLMLFFAANNQCPSPGLLPRFPTGSVSSIPNTIRTYSSSTPLFYGPHPRLMSGLDFLPSSPPIHKEWERRRLRKKNRPYSEGRIELVDMAHRYSFSVLEPTPPLPTQPLALAMPSALVMMARGLRRPCLLKVARRC